MRYVSMTLLASIAATFMTFYKGVISTPMETTRKDGATRTLAQIDRKERARKLVMLVEKRDLSTKEFIDFANLKIHAPEVVDTKESKMDFFSQHEGQGKVKIARVLQDGDKVAVHFSRELNGQKTVNWSVFKFNSAGKVNELWTNSTADTTVNASGHSMLDGTVAITDLKKTAANKATMQTFFDSVIVGGKFMLAGNYYNGDKLIQHDPHAGDGVQALTAYSMGLAKAGRPQIFNKVHLLVGEGNFVLVATDYVQAQMPRAYFELYRLDTGKIAERWLVDEAIQPKENWKNTWGKY